MQAPEKFVSLFIHTVGQFYFVLGPKFYFIVEEDYINLLVCGILVKGLIAVVRRLTLEPTRLLLILTYIRTQNLLIHYFLILLLTTVENCVYNPFSNILSFLQPVLQMNLLYYYYAIPVLILQTNHKSITHYHNHLKEIWRYRYQYFLQISLISSSKLNIPCVCGIAIGCLGCRYRNHTWAMGGIEKSNIYQYFVIFYGLGKIVLDRGYQWRYGVWG